MPPLTKSPETLCFLFVRWVGCPSVMGFCHRDNFKTAEGIKVKLGTSMYNDAKINCLRYGVKRSQACKVKFCYRTNL